MKLLRRVASFSAALFLAVLWQSASAQTVIFTEDFETGKPKAGWSAYYRNEDTLLAVASASAPKALATAGNYVGYLKDADTTYAGSAVAVFGDLTLKNYSIEADIYVYTGQSPSAYTGLVAYADSSKKDFYKLRADFGTNNRINFSGLKSDTNTFQPLFNKNFTSAQNPELYPTTDGWHKLKLEIQSTSANVTTIWPYFDGTLLVGAPIIDTTVGRNTAGKFGLYTFKNNAGIAGYFDNIVVKTLPLASVSNHYFPNAPEGFALSDNYPNPFNPSTTIAYQLPSTGAVSLVVYDQVGREVATLVNQSQAAGVHVVAWDGRDAAGRIVASGSYFYRLSSGGNVQTKRMVLMK
jgi:hypothetical protein